MSANSLSNLWPVITVEDEMESFFHLLLFYAIRYLPHNCKDVGMFVNEYFDGYTKTDGQYFCGSAKWAAMIGGRISLHNNAGPLTFYLPVEPDNNSAASSSHSQSTSAAAGAGGPHASLSSTGLSSPSQETLTRRHPINTVFARLLKWLQAHYALTNEQRSPTARHNVASTPEAGEDAKPTEEEMWFVDSYALDDESELEDEEEARDVDELSPERRATLKKLAAKLKEHKYVINALGRAQFRPNKFGPWPECDKVPDQLRSEFLPDRDPEPRVAVGSKRDSLHDADDAEMPPAKRRSTRSRSMTVPMRLP